MKKHTYFSTGQTIVLREVLKGRIWSAKPGIVVQDTPEMLAVAKFRNVAFGQYLEAWDDISGETWDKRHVENKLELQEKLFWLSVEACLSL
jgi:hypothetical protein